MDPPLPSNPVTGFQESLSRGSNGQNRSIEEVVVSPLRQEPRARKKGYFVPSSLKWFHSAQLSSPEGVPNIVEGISGPGLLYEKP
jgi:hypothetical protein